MGKLKLTHDRNTYEIPKPMRCKNREKIFVREKIYIRKKIITHKIVFMWFGNLPISTELQGFHYSQEKIQSAAVQFFSLKNNIKTLISKTTIFISCAQDSQWAQKRAKKIITTLFQVRT